MRKDQIKLSMRKDQIKLSNVKNLPALVTGATFDNHMKLGDHKGGTHSGLHLISEFKKADSNTPPTYKALAGEDIVKGKTYTGTLGTRSGVTVTITEVDLRAKTFKASVNVYGTAKVSTFFPVGTTITQAKAYIAAAWKDACTYGCATYGGGDVDIYKQMRNAFRLNWVGIAKIAGQDIWIGCAHSGSVDTAFPAVNNKFGQ